MKKELIKYWIIGILFTSIVGTLSHFLYEWTGNNILAGLFTPVNEAAWEHIKMLFFPMLFYTFYVSYSWKGSRPCAVNALFAGNIIGCMLIPVLYYSYSGILGFGITAVDISIYYICVLTAFYTAYRLTRSCKVEQYRYLLTAAMGILAILFWLFTFRHPDIALFREP